MTLWQALKPGHQLWLATALARHGLLDADEALTAATQGRVPGTLPASVRPGEVAVREQLCPAPDAAVLVQRASAWCQRTGKQCPHLQQVGGDWVVCGACPRLAGKWWDIGGGGKPKEQSSGNLLSKLVKLLGPGLLGGLVGLQLGKRKLSRQLAGKVPTHPLFVPVSAVLKQQRVTWGYDSSKRQFNLPKATIKLRANGLVLLGPTWSDLAGASNWPTKLVKFLAKLKRS